MRLLVCLFVCLLPSVTSAQAVASASGLVPTPVHETQRIESLDVLPAAMDERTMGILFFGVAISAYLILTGLSNGDDKSCGEWIVAGATTLAVCTGVAYCIWGNDGGAPRIQASSGVAYDTDAVAAFRDDALTLAQRQALAETARANGRTGVVLQRVVETRAGVGEAPGAYALEVSVVDAETGHLRPLVDDPLGASSVLSMPIEDDFEAAQATALAHLMN